MKYLSFQIFVSTIYLVKGQNDARSATECMLNLCTSCDISGRERRVATGLTLEQCKSICLDNSTCLGIDFGKNSRAGECYFNFEQNINFGSHGNFDAWSKSTNCVLFCDELTVSRASDTSFNGEYVLGPFTANAAPNREVYEKRDGSKVIFWKNGEWAIGPRASLTTGLANYGGLLRGSNNTWLGKGSRRGSVITVTDTSKPCSEEFENDDVDDEDDGLRGDLTGTFKSGRNECRGSLSIIYSLARDTNGPLSTIILQPASYKNTGRVFRRRSIQVVEVDGNCSWRLYPQRWFGGAYRTLTPGFRSYVPFLPLSIVQM